LEVDSLVRAAAQHEVVSPATYISNLVCRVMVADGLTKALHVASNTSTAAPYAPTTAQKYPPAAGCAHTDKRVLSTGIAWCNRCGAMREMSGRWKVVQ